MDLGTDINSDWELTEHGDLRIVSQEDNLAQAIINRLSCSLNSLSLYYPNYGSLIYGFFGWKRNDATLEFMKIELGNRLDADPRINNHNIILSYNDEGDVVIKLTISTGNGNVDLDLLVNTQTGAISEVV